MDPREELPPTQEGEKENNEHPKNFLSDLCVNSRGWLYSSHGHISSSDDMNPSKDAGSSKSPHPVVFPACEKLIKMFEKAKNDDEKKESKDNDEPPQNLPESNHNEKEKKEKKKVGKRNDAQHDEEVKELVNLVFVPNAMDQIVSVFTQLFKMSSRRPSNTNDGNNDKKVLSKGLKADRGKRSISSKSNVNPTEDEDWVAVGQDAASAFPDEFQEYYIDPSERMQITFNTIAVLLPILLPMKDHPHKDNTSIKMNRGPSAKEGGKRKAYLFFPQEGVYSISTEKQFRHIQRDINSLADIVNSLLVKVKGLPFDTVALDQSTAKNIIPLLFDSSVMSSADLIQKTLLPSLDPEVEVFARKMDDQIIRPLAMDRYDMHRLHKNSVQILLNRLTQIFTKKFRGAHLDVYGSCLSGLSLGNSSDVDISIYIPEAFELKQDLENRDIDRNQYQKQIKRLVYRVFDSLNPGKYGRHNRNNYQKQNTQSEFRNMEAVPHARVPVVKGNYLHANNPFSDDGSMHFDICILNDIAVANSGLLREYAMLDPRVKMLMLSVKSWIKWKGIGSAADQTLSSYTWMILVIFYLQCIGFVPNLQCPTFMGAHEVQYDSTNRMHTVNGLRTVYLKSELVIQHDIWQQPEQFKSTPVSALLAGFFLFYARHFPYETTAVSIRLGNLSLQKTVFKSCRLWRIVVEDPFETHDSHCPHDLGTPLSDQGHIKVTKAMQEAANRMENMYIDCTEIDDCIGSFCFVKNSPNSKTTGRSEIAGPDQSQGNGHTKSNHKGRKGGPHARKNNGTKSKIQNQSGFTKAHGWPDYSRKDHPESPKKGATPDGDDVKKSHGQSTMMPKDTKSTKHVENKQENGANPQKVEPSKRKKKDNRHKNKAPKKNAENAPQQNEQKRTSNKEAKKSKARTQKVHQKTEQ